MPKERLFRCDGYGNITHINCKNCADAKALVGELVELIRPVNLSDGLPMYNADKIDIAITKATAWLSKEGE